MKRFRKGVTSIAYVRIVKFVALLCMGSAVTCFAQGAPPGDSVTDEPTKTFFLGRTGETVETPHIATFHYLEFFQIRKRWIYPDIGYVDFGHGNYREFFIGGGRTLIENKIASWDQELLYDQALGSHSGSARYLQPWSLLRFHFTPKFTNETVYFIYFPLNDSAKFHQVIERLKFEYALKKHRKVGAGYAGTRPVGGHWLNKPFVTTTISTKAGALEFWLQKIPAGGQIEVRYVYIHTSH